MTTWSTVRTGDTVTVEIIRGLGGTVTGEVATQGSNSVRIGEVNLPKGSVKIISHKRKYRDGDIGLLKSDGANWVGIFSKEDDIFYDTDNGVMRSPLFSVHENLTIIGNINDAEEK